MKYVPSSQRTAIRPGRRGAILIVVLALLLLFSVVALAFVFYSSNEAEVARNYRDAQNNGYSISNNTPPDPTSTVNQALASLVFDTTDSGTDLLNALRGHSLVATMYGRIAGSSGMYNGPGTIHDTVGSPPGTFTTITDRAQFINYTAFPVNSSSGVQNVVMDPEWTGGLRTGAPTASIPTFPNPGTGRIYLPKNAPYTYPDLNNFYLSAISPATGEVLTPSFYRWWLFNANNPNVQYRMAAWNPSDTSASTMTSKNTDWITADGRAKLLRPRPIDQLTSGDLTTVGLPGTLPADPTTMTAGQQATLYNLITTLIKNGTIIGYPTPNVDTASQLINAPTGDVQNLIGGVGIVKNDSILLDINAPTTTFAGVTVKPLVALLIRDLDSLVNINAHGNTRNGGNQASYAGYGPWEVNLGTVLGSSNDAATIISAREGPSGQPNSLGLSTYGSAAGAQSMPYDRSGDRFALYGVNNWDAGGTPGSPPIQVPAFGTNPFSTSPVYGGSGFFDDNTSTGKAKNHPSLFNANDWARPIPNSPPPNTAATPTPFAYSNSDFRRLFYRYNDTPESYYQTTISRLSPPVTSVLGSSGARTEQANARRLLLTDLSAGFDLPAMPGNFNNIATGGTPSSGNALSLATGTYPAIAQFPGSAGSFNFPGPFPFASGTTPGTNADFGSNDGRNSRSGLGPIDLNRPLTDYFGANANPVPSSAPTAGSPTVAPATMPNLIQAWADRHNLARDIFGRLIIATGALATVANNGDISYPNLTVGSQEYNALQYLAQIAVNAVDFIDKDDISTAFIWFPPSGTLTAVSDVTTLQIANMMTTISSSNVVYGVEKPKLLINEAYGEIANDPTEKTTDTNPPSKPAHVRFWVELLNPTNTPYATGGTGPQWDGRAQVRYDSTAGDPVTYNPYKLVITQNQKTGVAQTASSFLQSGTGNSAGDLPAGFTPDIDYDFTNANSAAANSRKIMPNNGVYNPNGDPTKGLVLVGPNVPTATMGVGPQTFEFQPQPTAAPWQSMIQSPAQTASSNGKQNAMEYLLSSIPSSGTAVNQLGSTTFQRHVILLRRLANPYLPPNDPTLGFNPAIPINPYITVDYMDWVPAFDSVNRTTAETTTARQPKSGNPPTGQGYDPTGYRFSIGKVQPYAAMSLSTATATGNTMLNSVYSFPSSAVIAAQPQGFNQGSSTVPATSFGQHNGKTSTGPTASTVVAATFNPAVSTSLTDTIMAPFDWFIHFDRPLDNQLELLSLQACKPHEVTQLTLQQPRQMKNQTTGAPGYAVQKTLGRVPWMGVTAGLPQATPGTFTAFPGYDAANSMTHNGLYRAFDLLRVKPWTYGNALGGRQYGKININTIQDQRILQALLDAQSGNTFNATDVNNLWTSLITCPAGQAGNGFAGRTAYSSNRTQADGSTTWLVPTPGLVPTIDDLGATAFTYPNATNPIVVDRPFRPFGVAEFTKSGSALAMGQGSGLQDTILRGPIIPAWSASTAYTVGQRVISNGNEYYCTTAGTSSSTAGPTGTAASITDGSVTWTYPGTLQRPLIWVSSQSNAYLQAEMARKLVNNVTTVSNVFAVNMTIVYVAVRTSGGVPLTDGGAIPRQLLGQEVYSVTPGDLRQTFFAIVDRSKLTTNLGNSTTPGFYAALDRAAVTSPTLPGNPAPTPNSSDLYLANFQYLKNGVVTSLPSNAPEAQASPASSITINVMSDGNPITIQSGMTLTVGVGTTQEQVKVNYINQDGSVNVSGVNTATPTANLALTKAHAAGECVSNVVPGNPGPPTPTLQSIGIYNNPNSQYAPVIPYLVRIN